MWLLPVLTGALYAGAGWIARRRPHTLAGFDLLPRRLRERTDLPALGRRCARLLFLCAALSLAGAALLPVCPGEAAVAAVCCLPLPVLLAGGAWEWIRCRTKSREP